MSPSADRLVDRQPTRDWLVAALGAVVTAAALGHFLGHGDVEPLVVVATVLPALALLGYGVWFWAWGPRVASGDAVFAWAVGGAGVVLALDLWAMYVNAYGAGTATDHVFIQHTSVGALGAAIAGTYSERDRQRSRSHVRLRHALDAAMDGIAVLDDDRRIAYANAAFRDDYDADDSDDVVGTHWSNYYPDEAETRLGDVFDGFDDDSRDHWQGRLRARRDDGRTYPQDLAMTSLADEGYVWVCRDVTAREERDQRLRVLNRVLRHNVRNALNVVLGRAERLADRGETDEDVDGIVTAAEDLLAVSEKARVVERVLGEDDASGATLGDLVDAEVEHARSEYPDAEFDTDVDVDLEVDARLRLVVRELLSNAVEHNDSETPRVSVSASDGDDPVVRVTDDGSGIPEHERHALEGTEEGPLDHSSGIGLWVVYWIAQQCGATVDVTDDNTVTLHLTASETGADDAPDENG